MDDSGNNQALNPTALSIEQLVRVLTAAGAKSVTQETIETDVAAGAPSNADGTINLVHYAAWLVMQAGVRRPESGGSAVQGRS